MQTHGHCHHRAGQAQPGDQIRQAVRDCSLERALDGVCADRCPLSLLSPLSFSYSLYRLLHSARAWFVQYADVPTSIFCDVTHWHFKREAEEHPDVSEENEIVAVPTIIMYQAGKRLGRVDGADAFAVTKLVDSHKGKVAAVTASAASAAASPPAAAGGEPSKDLVFTRTQRTRTQPQPHAHTHVSM